MAPRRQTPAAARLRELWQPRPFSGDVGRAVLGVTMAQLGPLPVLRRDRATAALGLTLTVERRAGLRDERRIVHRDLLAGFDRPPRHEIEPIEPRVGITRVVDRRPLLGIGAPGDQYVV